MLSGKFVATLIGILIAIVAICNANFAKPVVEGWWGSTQFGLRGVPGAQFKDGTKVAINPNLLQQSDTMGSGKFFSVPTFQAMLSPRNNGMVNYGANIRYNPPAREHLAVPCDPLTFGDYASPPASKENFVPPRGQVPSEGRGNVPSQVKENYDCASCGSGGCGGGCGGAPSCGKGAYGFGHKVAGGYDLPPNAHSDSNNWQKVYDSLPVQGQNMGSDLPIGTMSLMDPTGNVEQAMVFERIMPFNMKGSRLASQGDFIRGDVAIAPCNRDWFQVHPNLSRDLQVGAMGAMFGMDGSSNKELMQLMLASTGHTRTTMSGVNISEELPKINPVMTNQMTASLTSAATDINWSGFP